MVRDCDKRPQSNASQCFAVISNSDICNLDKEMLFDVVFPDGHLLSVYRNVPGQTTNVLLKQEGKSLHLHWAIDSRLANIYS